MARKSSTRAKSSDIDTTPTPIKKDEQPEEEYFHKSPPSDYVLPPELNMTIRDGFRFGIGFILASVLFYLILIVGAIIFIKFGSSIQF